MATAPAGLGAGPPSARRPAFLAVRSLLWRRPEAWAYPLAAWCWVAVALGTAEGPLRLVGGSPGHGPAAALAHGAVMATAMMAPLVAPTIHHVALHSLWHRRYTAGALFLAAFVAVWAAVSALSTVAAEAGMSTLPGDREALRPAVVALAFLAAAAAQLRPGRQAALRRCRRVLPLAPEGRRADRDCVRLGLVTARACVSTCWVAMLAANLAHTVAAMGVVASVQYAERRQRVPSSRQARLGAVVLAATGALALLAPGG